MRNQLEQYFDRLWPINRSLTGNGNRKTLEILSEIVDIKVSEAPSGTECYDWTVPPEWNVKEAWIKNSKGEKIVDFAAHNLHLLGYSEPYKGTLSYEEMKSHIYTLPDQPDLIPYRTSYYERRWGFCMTHNQLLSLDKEDTYEIFIDASLDANGSMSIGEAIIKGQSDEEIIISTYICHPSMAINELSGPLVTSMLYTQLKKVENLKYTYRFIFIPETIGSIYLLSVMGDHFLKKLIGGLVITCVGDDGPYTYKRSRRGNTTMDRCAEMVLLQSESTCNIVDFFPNGSDERQYCSPGFNLPVGSLTRTMYAQYPEYHTSGDNKDLICFESMEKTVNKYLEIIKAFEYNEVYINTNPFCEVQLGKRGLLSTLGGQTTNYLSINTISWVLNLSDGTNDLFDISERSKIPIKELIPVIDVLKEKGLIKTDGKLSSIIHSN